MYMCEVTFVPLFQGDHLQRTWFPFFLAVGAAGCALLPAQPIESMKAVIHSLYIDLLIATENSGSRN